MPVNPGIEYQLAEDEYRVARTIDEKVAALEHMLATVPKHKGSEKLQGEIKAKLSKLRKEVLKGHKKQGKKTGFKKEGEATIVLAGKTNTGKSSLLRELTGAKVKIADYPFTTKNVQQGMMDFHGIKIQIVEIPAIVKNFYQTEHGPEFLSIIRNADLIVYTVREEGELNFLKSEIRVTVPFIVCNVEKANLESLKREMWRGLNLIKVHTKTPGKKPDYPPVAMKKDSTVRDLAPIIHKDFIEKFRFARLWGTSARFQGQQVGLEHILEDEDVVELHLK